MRRFDERIEVRLGRVGEQEGPSQFLWRNRLWRVLALQERWIESGAWWDSPRARAVRGDWTAGSPDEGADADLLCEREVWRVEAANGRSFSRGIYELVNQLSDGSWQLRAVMD